MGLCPRQGTSFSAPFLHFAVVLRIRIKRYASYAYVCLSRRGAKKKVSQANLNAAFYTGRIKQ